MLGRAQFLDRLRRGIQSEEMRVSLLFGGKINALRPPADETGIFVERFRQDLRRPTLRGSAAGALSAGFSMIQRWVIW